MLRIIKLVIPNASSSLGIYFIWDVNFRENFKVHRA